MDATPLRAGIYARVSKENKKASGRSVDEQETEARRACAAEGWSLVEVYSDPDLSASRFARKERPDWARLLVDLDAGKFDVLVLWESSRGDRTLGSWVGMLERARTHGVLLHVVSHARTYDPRVPRDWKALADDGVDSAYESEKTSLRIQRTKAAGAEAGRPDGRCPYGYTRRYDPVTRALVAQEPDPEQAPVVRDVFDRIVRGEPITTIAADLGLARNRVRRIATNPAYVGKRRYNGTLYDGSWPPLVAEATYYAAQRLLSDPARKTTRPGRVKHLLSYLAACGVCGADLTVRRVRGQAIYVCRVSHAGIRQEWLDRFVTELVIRRLSSPDIYPALTAADDAAVVSARGEADALRHRLDEFYDAAAAGDLTAAALTRVEARLLPQIDAAEKRATMAATPPALRALVDPGADLRQRWDRMSTPAKKDVVRELVETIRLHPTPLGRASRYEAISPERVEITWRQT